MVTAIMVLTMTAVLIKRVVWDKAGVLDSTAGGGRGLEWRKSEMLKAPL